MEQMNSQKNWKWKLIPKFFTNLMRIPDSNMYGENMFSHINNIKTSFRNLLPVNSVSNLKSQIILFNSKENAGIRELKSDWEHCFI